MTPLYKRPSKHSNSMTPFFSIVIPTYNGLSSRIEACFDAIWKQPLDAALYEVICVDNGSTDGTRAWLETQTAEHDNLHVVFNKENIWQGGSKNVGAAMAQGKYILFLDCDDYFHPGSLLRMYEFLKDKDLDVFVSDSAYQFVGHESNKLQLHLRFREQSDLVTFVRRNGWTIAPWRLALRRDFYQGTGVTFMEKTRIEDVDWAIQVLYYAKTIQYQPILLVHYNKGESGITDNMYRNKEGLKANIEAGNRTYGHAMNLYKGHPLQGRVIALAQSYYNFSCKYLLGMACSLKEKKAMVDRIPQTEGAPFLVRMAKRCPWLYCVCSQISIPFFRGLRYIHRRRTAKQFEN